jgi:hypothetical protein
MKLLACLIPAIAVTLLTMAHHPVASAHDRAALRDDLKKVGIAAVGKP